MQNTNPKRPKTPRVTRLELPPGLFEATIDRLQQRDVLLRLALCMAAAAIMWAVTGAGRTPFPYRLGDTPVRTIVVTYPFSQEDKVKTHQQKEIAKSAALVVYDNNEDVLTNIREELKNKVVSLTQPTQDEKLRTLWKEFYIPPPETSPAPAARRTNTPTVPVAAPAPAAQTNSAGKQLPLSFVALVAEDDATKSDSEAKPDPGANSEQNSAAAGDVASEAAQPQPPSTGDASPQPNDKQPESTQAAPSSPETTQPNAPQPNATPR